MKDTALYREWRHGWSLQPPRPFVDTMRRLYHELGPETCRDLVAIGPVVVEGGAFQIHEDGEWCFLTPVLYLDSELWRALVWDCGFEPEAVRRANTEVVDIVAWHPATPGQWARRIGEAHMLGDADARLGDEPLRVHQTPYGWLKAGGEGVCFLDRDRQLIALALRNVHQIVAENAAHARELRDICARPYPIPRIIAA